MALKHTELTNKEVAGVIDHADESITADKLASGIDAVPKKFNAYSVNGIVLAFTWDYRIPQLNVNEIYHLASYAATTNIHYFATLGYYEKDYQANYHRLAIFYSSHSNGMKSVTILNEGPNIAYGILVKVWAIFVPAFP